MTPCILRYKDAVAMWTLLCFSALKLPPLGHLFRFFIFILVWARGHPLLTGTSASAGGLIIYCPPRL